MTTTVHTTDVLHRSFQRGLATGIMHNKKGGAKWPDSHRERLHRLANDVTYEKQSVLMPIGSSGQAEIQNISGSILSEYYMDVAMSGGAWQCDWGDGSCDEMKWVEGFGAVRSQHKELIPVDQQGTVQLCSTGQSRAVQCVQIRFRRELCGAEPLRDRYAELFAQ